LFKELPHYSPYSFSGNRVIASIEYEGLEDVWVIENNSIVHKTGPRIKGFTSEEVAFNAWSLGIDSPSGYQSYTHFISRTANNVVPARPQAMMRADDLDNFVNKHRHRAPGVTIARGIIDGAREAPMVILPEIALAKLGAAYQAWKASRQAAKTVNSLDDVVKSSVNILDNAQQSRIVGAGQDEMISIYRAPYKGTVDDVMKKGFDKTNHLEGNKSIHFGEETVAKEYARVGTYDPYLIEVKVPKAWAKQFKTKYLDGSGRAEYVIPVDKMDELNNFQRIKGGLE
jgi:hypothetical protein